MTSANPPSFDLSRYQDPLTIQRVLYNARTIAVVGLSPNELRASYFVGYYLKRHGYRVIPVNIAQSLARLLWTSCRALGVKRHGHARRAGIRSPRGGGRANRSTGALGPKGGPAGAG